MKILVYILLLLINGQTLASYLNLNDYGYKYTNQTIYNVNLKNKNLTELAEPTFDYFSIIILELSYNQIEQCSSLTFTNIKYLNTLNLNNNLLKSIN